MASRGLISPDTLMFQALQHQRCCAIEGNAIYGKQHTERKQIPR